MERDQHYNEKINEIKIYFLTSLFTSLLYGIPTSGNVRGIFNARLVNIKDAIIQAALLKHFGQQFNHAINPFDYYILDDVINKITIKIDYNIVEVYKNDLPKREFIVENINEINKAINEINKYVNEDSMYIS